LSSITIAFNEALNSGALNNPGRFSVNGGVTKRGKTTYSKKLGIGGITYNATAHTATITLAKPFKKGSVQVVVNAGIMAANGALSKGSFTMVVK
jgi:hypothetical protein